MPMKSSALNESFDPWRETPRSSIIVILVSVFLFFTTVGFANDIISMGREQTPRFVLGVLVPASFAVASLLTFLALVTLAVKVLLERKTRRDLAESAALHGGEERIEL